MHIIFSMTTDIGSAHNAQKPEKLLERIVLASTRVGDLVLDPLDPMICMEAITDLYSKYGKEIDKKLEKIVKIKDMARSSIV